MVVGSCYSKVCSVLKLCLCNGVSVVCSVCRLEIRLSCISC